LTDDHAGKNTLLALAIVGLGALLWWTNYGAAIPSRTSTTSTSSTSTTFAACGQSTLWINGGGPQTYCSQSALVVGIAAIPPCTPYSVFISPQATYTYTGLTPGGGQATATPGTGTYYFVTGGCPT
jgi:hypothetical protein